MSVAFDNVKAVTEQLEQLLVDSGESLPSARRYYGMYTILLTALDRMHDELLATIGHYHQQLDTVVEKTRSLMAKSESLRRHNDRHQRTLTANIEAQRLTLSTAKTYQNYLNKQARHIVKSQQRLSHDIAVARNTFDTVTVSGELIQLVHSGEQSLELLFSRQAPTMFTFQNLELKREFEKLTNRLRATEGN